MQVFANGSDVPSDGAQVEQFLNEIENTSFGEFLGTLRVSAYDLTVHVRTSHKGNKVYCIINDSAVNETDGTVLQSSVEVVVSPNGDIISKVDNGWEIIYV